MKSCPVEVRDRKVLTMWVKRLAPQKNDYHERKKLAVNETSVNGSSGRHKPELANLEEDDENVQNRGEVVRIIFCKDEQLQRAGVNKPRVGTLEELKVSFVHYLKEHDPQQLECKVEQILLDRGHKILWTPPYCPELQPIELFWAAGKNHVAAKFETNQTMRNVVKYLREGWYVREW